MQKNKNNESKNKKFSKELNTKKTDLNKKQTSNRNKQHRNNILEEKKKPTKSIIQRRTIKKKISLPSVRIIPLGGLNEIGKNITAIECGNDIIIIDCGTAFPDDDMLGIDLVVPDFSYLLANADKVRGIFLTHGHEDHIGSLPFLLKDLNVPVYGTKLTLGIVENKLQEHKLLQSAKLNTVSAGDKIVAGCFKIEFIRVNHSIADSCALAITTPRGVIVHTGDFKLDLTPIESEPMDIARLAQLGKEGVLLMLCESTNVERPGYTPSERTVGVSLDKIFLGAQDKRIIISTFASNVHRVQQIINASITHDRKVAITGRSMQNVISAAVRLGYMKVPDGALIDIDSIRNYPPEKLTIVTTGSQGEPMSGLYRMAFSDHDKISLDSKDLVVLSSSAIPGNEPMVGKIINELYRRGVNVYHDNSVEVHVSGHACQEELKLMHLLIKPKYFMPVHGEYRHLVRHKELAVTMGMDPANIFISDIGKVLEIDDSGAKLLQEPVQAGIVLIDGSGFGDVGNIVLRDRKNLAESGIILVVATISLQERIILAGPEIISRGFIYVRENEDLVNQCKDVAYKALENAMSANTKDWNELKNIIKNSVSKFVYNETKRKPVILPILLNV